MKRIVCCLMMLAMMFVLAACSEMDQQDHREEAAVIHWPASDTSIHTAQSGTLPRAAQSLLAANADLSINWKRIDGITLYEIYPTDAVNLPVVFLLHEHGASKDQYLPEAVTYAQSGYFCILMDLIGYGERPDANAVESIEAAVMATADIDLLLEYYRLSPYADSNHFALYGQSMGGSAVWHYVAYGKHTPEAVVTACSVADFTRVQDMGCIQNGRERDPQWNDMEYTEYCSAHNPMTNRERLSSVPMLVFQGLQDTVVSPNVTRAFEHYVTSAADHNATFIYDENAAHEATPSFITRVIPFLKQFLR